MLSAASVAADAVSSRPSRISSIRAQTLLDIGIAGEMVELPVHQGQCLVLERARVAQSED